MCEWKKLSREKIQQNSFFFKKMWNLKREDLQLQRIEWRSQGAKRERFLGVVAMLINVNRSNLGKEREVHFGSQ